MNPTRQATDAVWAGEERLLLTGATAVPVSLGVAHGYPDFDAWQAVALYYASMGIAWTLWRRHSLLSGSAERQLVRHVRRIALLLAGLMAVWILAQPWALFTARGDGLLHVTFVDVGQGDAVLLRFPRGSSMLVDAASS